MFSGDPSLVDPLCTGSVTPGPHEIVFFSQRSCFLKIRPHPIVGFERVRRYRYKICDIHQFLRKDLTRVHPPNRPRTNFYPIKRYLRRPGKMRHRVAHQIFMGVGLLQGGVLTGKSHIASSSEIAKIACYTLCKTL